MIQADTRELETKLKQTVLNIRQKEVSLFTDQFAVLASSATFMSSLGFGALNMEIGFLEKNENGYYCSELVGCDGRFLKILTPLTLFYGCAAAGTACNLLTVILSSFCMIFGPELAIRGTDGSMHHAVQGMYEERRRALTWFWVGCLFIILSGIALGWMKFPHLTASLITVIFVVLVAFCARYVRRLEPKFAYEDVNSANLVEAMRPTTGHHTAAVVRTGGDAHRPPEYAQERRGTLEPGLAAASPYKALKRRPSALERLVDAAEKRVSYGTSGAPSATASQPGPPDAAAKSGTLFVDGMLRYAVLDADAGAAPTLRLFSLDGRALGTFAAATITVDGALAKFALALPSGGEQLCRGTTDKDTRGWLACLEPAGATCGCLKHLG